MYGFRASRSASTSSPTRTLTVARDLEALGGAPAMLGAERVVEALGVDEDRQPAVGDLRGERDVLRPDRGEVDRDVGAQRPHHHLQRLAEPGRARPVVGDAVVLALVGRPTSRRSAVRTISMYSRVFAERLAPRLAVPALDDLRARGAEAEDEAAARHEVERRRGHRGVRGRAARDLHDRRADLDPARRRGEPREHARPRRCPRPPRPRRSRSRARSACCTSGTSSIGFVPGGA